MLSCRAHIVYGRVKNAGVCKCVATPSAEHTGTPIPLIYISI